jgi:hypothetical protein
MNAPLTPSFLAAQTLAQSVAQACERVAPTWPLDRFIAVNPCWGWRDLPVPQVAAELGVLAGSRLTLPREACVRAWREGRLNDAHLDAALARQGRPISLAALIAHLQLPTPPAPRLPLLSDLRDAAEPGRAQPWVSLVVHQISQHCAAFFDPGQAAWTGERSGGLWASWRRQVRSDRGLPWRSGHAVALAPLAQGPSDAMAWIGWALDRLGLPAAAQLPYLSALLLSVSGWAAWCAQLRWQARLVGQEDAVLVDLLAVRLAWELLLWADAPGLCPPTWASDWAHATERVQILAEQQRIDWLLQDAMELAYQQPLCQALARPVPEPLPEQVVAQAVFCIDVRSEPLRRALEAADPGVQTHGFAGFFGLPLAYTPLGSPLTRPQLPGLLAPQCRVAEVLGADPQEGDPAEGTGLGQWLARRRQQALAWRLRWRDLRHSPSSGFSLVETTGLAAAASLLKRSLPSPAAALDWTRTGLPEAGATLRPQWPQPVDAAAEQADVALLAGILRAMGLTRDFAPLLLLIGHGSQSANNPHAASLDCGACGGQTGEVNARVLAELLNRPAMRAGLEAQGITLPASTWAVAGLHNTCTDELTLFDLDRVPAAHQADLARVQAALLRAAPAVRAERAPALGLASLVAQPAALARALRQRANDWAQVRPEWGLVDNAAFIVAPRARTRHLNLAGRSFLHDYDWRQDPEGQVLTQIMTAPMVVTHWINWQYLASSVDPQRFGSGNKLLHNVVGQGLGVFEGNGGDLRIGLPWQSVADGAGLRHTPLRLSVFIAAPRERLDQVIAEQVVVAQLVEQGWLHLFALTDAGPVWRRRPAGGWEAAA